MRRPARNLLYGVLGVFCIALLVEAVGLPLPGFLRVLTAISRGPEASSRVPVTASPRVEGSCTASSSIERAVEPVPIDGGSFIMFRSAISVDGMGAAPVRIFLSDSTITFSANGTSYSLPVPAATVTLDPGASAAATSFEEADGSWATTVPAGASGEAFLSAYAFRVPEGGLPEGIGPVTWSVALSTDTPGVTAHWQWDASVSSEFNGDYRSMDVQGAAVLAAKVAG